MTTQIDPRKKVTPEQLPKINNFVCDPTGKYTAKRPLTAEQIIKAAQILLTSQFKPGNPLKGSDITREFLRMTYQGLEHEVFACLFLDNQNCVIAHEVLFRGTIDAATVYPREVAKRALQLNAAAVIFAHNHPSGATDPSFSDKEITKKLALALSLFDIRTLDHFIVSKRGAFSFAEHGLIK